MKENILYTLLIICSNDILNGIPEIHHFSIHKPHISCQVMPKSYFTTNFCLKFRSKLYRFYIAPINNMPDNY